jgi:hypothetical protein
MCAYEPWHLPATVIRTQRLRKQLDARASLQLLVWDRFPYTDPFVQVHTAYFLLSTTPTTSHNPILSRVRSRLVLDDLAILPLFSNNRVYLLKEIL